MPYTVMWSETVGLRTTPIWDPKNRSWSCRFLLCCETQSCQAHRYNNHGGHSSFSSTIYSFTILYLDHHYCGDHQQWLSLT